MIYTCTLNPAIDLFIETQQLKPRVVNRTNNYDIQANGKGVNVSFILKMLGIDNTALGVKFFVKNNQIKPIIFVLLISTALNGQKIKNSARLITDRASLNYQ